MPIRFRPDLRATLVLLAMSATAWAETPASPAPTPSVGQTEDGVAAAPSSSAAPPAIAPANEVTRNADGFPVLRHGPWNRLLFMGLRSEVGIPIGVPGISTVLALELGYAPRGRGIGWGLLLLGALHTPELMGGAFPAPPVAIGSAVAMRYYFEIAGPVQLFPSLEFGFALGSGSTALTLAPILNTGFGLRARLGEMLYLSVELGIAGFQMPYLGLAFGFCSESEW